MIQGLAVMFGIVILAGIGFLIAFKIQEIHERKKHSH
jgi:hypothetical protein